MKERKLLLLLAQSLIGTGFFFLYVHHVRSIFESRTNIAHRTQLERESMLRREDALYFSFYKTLTGAPDFWSGYEQLKNVTDIEYPRRVNVLQRFYVLPELTIAYFYHLLRPLNNGQMFFLNCWHTHELHLPLEQTPHCDGFGQAMQFYLEFVWLLGGFTILIIYMYGTLLSENIFGGIYAVVSYIMFHRYASKIYERPLARENFAFPLIFLQMFYLCLCIDRVTTRKVYKSRIFVTIKFTLLTATALLCWQFSSIIFATQILIMMRPWSLTPVPNHVSSAFTLDYVLSQLLGNFLAYVLSLGSRQFVFAWQIGPAIALFVISLVRRVKEQSAHNEASLKTISLGILLAISAQGTIIDLLEKTGLARTLDNSFTLYRDLIVHWGLQAKVNFSTSLAACNSAYARMAWVDLWDLVKTLIVKPYCMYGVVMLAKFFRKWRKSSEQHTPSSDFVERAKKYVLEDFLEENHISMREMSNKETEQELNQCLKLLEECSFDYERYMVEKAKARRDKPDEHLEFINDIKKLKEQISQINELKRRNRDNTSEKTITKEGTTEAVIDDNLVGGESQQVNIDDKQQKGDELPNADESATKPSKNETKQSDVTNGNGGVKQPNNAKTNAKLASSAGNCKAFNSSDFFSFHYLYSFIQMAVFTVLGLGIRKLFFLSFTQGCVIAPTICSKFWYRKQRNIFWSVSLAVFLTSIANPGFLNIHEEYYPKGHTAGSDDLDTMLEWIQMNTERDAVFAGPIEIIGTVHLTTKRPIVNHAHLEMRAISDRTEQVYSVYSRQQSSDIYNQCSQLKIQYLIISLIECTNDTVDDCDMLSIWDDMQPAYRKYPQFCSELANKNVPSFLKVFSNDYYGIIKMFSQSVQINLKYSKMPEKVM